jgi:hypothetical protein
MNIFLPCAVGLVGLVLACSGTDAADRPSPSPSRSLEFDAISMHRTMCMGKCPVYAVEISAKGQVTYTGTDFVKVKGGRTSRISQDDVELLSVALRRVRFSQMRDKFQSEKDGCVINPTDYPSVVISVTKAGKAKEIVLYAGCEGPTIPAEDLLWLADTIDAVSKSNHLVK